MSNFKTELYKALASGSSIDEIVRSEIESCVNFLLKTELTSFLDYEPYDTAGYNTGNSRNGYYARTIMTRYGDIEVQVPRDRNGEFKQQTIRPYKRNTDNLETTILPLYSKGITTSEISDLIEKMYGHAYTPATISNMTKAVEDHVKEIHERALNKRYAVIYMDAIYLNVRRDSVSKEALHILVGITPEGYKEVLDYRLYPTECAENYKEMLQDIYQRGCHEVLLFVSNGRQGLRDRYLEIFPHAQHQSCWVHIQRNVLRLVRNKDKQEVADALKAVYQCKTLKEANKALDDFIETYKDKYPKIQDRFENRDSLFSWLSFPKDIQCSLYTSNLIEGLNKQLKRKIKQKEQFPNEESLERFVCTRFMEYNQQFSNRVHRGFNKVQKELVDMFDQQYK